MNSGSLYFQNSDEMIEIQCRERWLIYQRLQELSTAESEGEFAYCCNPALGCL
jgi:hypothetical protein